MARNDRPDVAVATREALEGVTGAAQLLDAIEVLRATIAEAEQRLPTELADADRDLRDTRTALAELGQLDPGVAGRVREAERAIDQAHEASREQPVDPVRALQLATDAHRIADAVLVAARDAAAAHDRLEAAADSSIRTASTEYDRAATFIASRRRGVGEGAGPASPKPGDISTRRRPLPPAIRRRRSRGRAARSSSPNDAYRLASSDFSDWDQGGPGWGQRGGTSDGDATADILGQILGGVIGGVIRSGGGGGWGGSPWGGPVAAAAEAASRTSADSAVAGDRAADSGRAGSAAVVAEAVEVVGAVGAGDDRRAVIRFALADMWAVP